MGLRRTWIIAIVAFLLAAAAAAQVPADAGGLACCPALNDDYPRLSTPSPLPLLDFPAPRPRMAPDLALRTYLQLAEYQLTQLGSYSDETVVEADLPDTKQHGRYELRRSFLAPKSLAYATVRFIGDGFVKTTIITRLLQSETQHVENGEGARMAIVEANYKFNFRGVDGNNGAYVFHVKPRKKLVGLFKGKIQLDPATGRLLRAEGTVVKSPSFFIKKLEFVQDYATVGDFSLPVHIHTVAKARIVGRAVVDIFHNGYQAKSIAQILNDTAATAASSAAIRGDN
jgi:hypothetical protein